MAARAVLGLSLAVASAGAAAQGGPAAAGQGDGWRGLEWLRGFVPGLREPRPVPAPPAPAWRLSDLLTGSGSGFARSLAPRPFEFPRDHGPHDAFRTEWWYFTGHLRTAAAPEARRDGGAGRHDGAERREFGYQLTFFRFALAPPGAALGPSPWAARHVYMAHFALTDVAGRTFRAGERLGRGALGIAGAVPGRVWIDDWSMTGPPWPLVLRAATRERAIELRLERGGKPIVAQGERGFSRKSERAASYYYSAPRLPTAGRVRVGDAEYAVRGESWWDREWGSGTLAPGQAGWDWFALHLDGGRELMVYRLRRRDGAADPYGAGVWVGADGGVRRLAASDFAIEARGQWRSPRTGALYPAAWRIRVPALGARLELAPRLPDQELALSVRYWEGAVSVSGQAEGAPAAGLGYAELTGYGEDAPPPGR